MAIMQKSDYYGTHKKNQSYLIDQIRFFATVMRSRCLKLSKKFIKRQPQPCGFERWIVWVSEAVYAHTAAPLGRHPVSDQKQD